MIIDTRRPDVAVQATRENQDWSSQFYENRKQQNIQTGDWVKLSLLPNPYSFDEALLLCQLSNDEWLVWIPDHGEAVLTFPTSR
ncbi:MAG: hypothetical protein ACHBN1_35135 [Heteroscytonema crispum UTEX LB 1556]